MTGFRAVTSFLMGPWGIAIGVAIAALTAFGIAQSQARGRIADLTSTLDRQTGAITEDTRQKIVNRLSSEGMLEVADALGISLVDLTDSVTGNAEAQERVNAAMVEGLTYGSELREGLGEHKRRVGDLWRELELANEELQASQREWKLEAEAKDGSADAADRLEPAQRQLAESLGVTAERAVELTDELSDMDAQLKALFDSVFGLSRAEDELTEAFRKATDQYKESTDGLDGNSQAAIANRRTAEDLLGSYADLVLKTVEHTGSQEEAEKAARDFERQLDKLERQTGVNVRELEGYNDVVAEIERMIQVHFNTPGAREAEQRARDIQRALERIERTVTIDFVARGELPAGGVSVARQHGGIIPGFGGPDTRIARVTPGEFVTTPSATSRNRAALEAANAGARLAVVGTGGGARTGGGAGGPGILTGNLYLDSGQFLGVVRGEISGHDRDLRRRMTAGTGAAR